MNSTELVSLTRRVGQLSTQDPVYDAAAILEELTNALQDRFAEPMTTLRQGYALQTSTVSTTSGTNFVRLPTRGVVQGSETIEISDDGGASFNQLIALTHAQAISFLPTQQDVPSHYTLEGDTLRLYPIPNGTYSIKIRYYLRHPRLMTFASSGLVATVGASSITTTTDPSTLSISTSTGCDIQNADGSHELAVVSGTISSITGAGPYTINFDSSVSLAKVRVGDYIRPPDQCVLPMIVDELARPLCDYTAAMIWVSKGDKEKATNLSQKAEAGINRVVQMAQPRNKTGQFKFRPSGSFLRRNVVSRWR